MYFKQKKVGRIPLSNLWNEQGELNAARIRYLGFDDFEQLAFHKHSALVVAELGMPLSWFDSTYLTANYMQLKTNIALDPEGFYLNEYPDHFVWLASEWMLNEDQSIILLEKYH